MDPKDVLCVTLLPLSCHQRPFSWQFTLLFSNSHVQRNCGDKVKLLSADKNGFKCLCAIDFF